MEKEKAAAYEAVAEVRAAGFGSSSAPPTHPRSQFFFLFLSLFFLASLFVYCSLTYFFLLTPLCLLVFSLRVLPFIFALLSLLSFVSLYRS